MLNRAAYLILILTTGVLFGCGGADVGEFNGPTTPDFAVLEPLRPGDKVMPVAVSSNGLVAVASQNESQEGSGYLWSNGKVTIVPLLEGDKVQVIKGVSRDGTVVGVSQAAIGAEGLGFISNDGTVGPYRVSTPETRLPIGISDDGVVVSSDTIVYRNDHGNIKRLGMSSALFVNRLGHVLGQAGTKYAWYRNGQVSALDMPAQAAEVYPFGFTDDDALVGTYRSTDGKYYGFRWSPQGFERLGTNQSGVYFYPQGGNSLGEIVGHLDGKAVLWRDGQFTDLSGAFPSGTDIVKLTAALDINDDGVIVGMATTTAGATKGFLLRLDSL